MFMSMFTLRSLLFAGTNFSGFHLVTDLAGIKFSELVPYY